MSICVFAYVCSYKHVVACVGLVGAARIVNDFFVFFDCIMLGVAKILQQAELRATKGSHDL